MKFYCDSCNTKYSIAEEKVRGKILKVRCKNCGHIITVREAQTPVAPAASARPAPPPAAAVPQTNWHYSLNGESFGPFDLATLKQRYGTGELGDETYVWHETLVAWKPVKEVDVFRDSLSKGAAVKPRAKTIGFTGPLEAIKVDKAPAGPQAGAVPESAKPTPEAKARSVTPMGAPRQDRLDKLREKLKSEQPEPAKATTPEPQQPETFDDAPTAMLTFAPGVEAAPPVGQSDVPRSKSAIDLPGFDLPSKDAGPAPAEDAIPQVETSSRSDVLTQPADLPPSPSDSGSIPFFPDVPKLEGHAPPPTTQSQTTTGSLLIEIAALQKEGRGKVIYAAMGIGAFFAAILGVALYLYMNTEKNQEPAVAVVQEKQKTELVEKTYKKNVLNEFGKIDLEEEVIDKDVDVKELEMEFEEEEKVEKAEPKAVVKKTNIKTEEPKPPKIASAEKPKEKKVEKPEAEEPEKKLTGREALLAYKGSGSAIARPEDKLAAGAAMPTELTKDAAKRGFRRVTKSVAICRERHARRAKFNAKKIYLSVTVEPTGKVSKVSVKPSSMTNTEFDKCMNSHRGRWRFAAWQGKSVEINRSFVMQ